MTTERTYKSTDREWKNLNAVAKMLEAVSKNGYRYEVEDCYFDLGQDWMFTTIICHGRNANWQVGCPRDWRRIVEAESLEELTDVANTIRHGSFYGD